MRFAICLSVAAVPCFAQVENHPQRDEFLSFLGGQGCTLSVDSVDRAEALGIAREDVRDIAAAALDAGEAREQGAYIVFDKEVCQIRLPEIVSTYSIADAAIQAGAPYVRETFNEAGETYVEEGCFVEDAFTLFAELEEFDPQAGFEAFIAFMGAGLISGDVRFYGTSPLRSPKGFQVVAGGECATAPNVEMVNTSHAHLSEGFADYVRFVGRVTDCGDPVSLEAGPFTARLQGFDHSLDVAEQAPINAWMDFEFLFITMAAGWHEGMTDVDRGTPRPPLCHYDN